jgi:1-acyl-sn-glycerol-3-phosphate acyltransferase
MSRLPRDLPAASPAFYRFVRAVVMAVCRPLFRVHVVGTEQLPPTGPYIVAPTHRSLGDVPFCTFITRRVIRFLAKVELMSNPVGGWFFGNLGAVPVDRGTTDRGAMRVLEAVLREGDPVALFPEGTRAEGPQLAPLFDGASYLAVKLGVPIVPVGIGGTEHILPKGSKLPRFHRVAVVVGRPLYPAEIDGGSRRKAAAKLTAELHTELQECFSRALALSGSPTR